MVSPQARVRAPELSGRGWFNTQHELQLSDLRGKIVLLDFWTFCCINCLHVLDALRPLEDKYADLLVVIGVHSPKFDHERDKDALAAAIARYGVEHPVLDDPDLKMWDAYAARAWPTLTVIDPEGYVVASMAGEGHEEGLDQLIGSLVETHRDRGTLRMDGGLVAPPPEHDGPLSFPGKAVELANGNLLVSDSAHHQLVELDSDAETVVARIGSGTRGHADGDADTAQLNEPQGLCLLPDEVARQVGYDILIADTVNHLLRGLRLSDHRVTTVAGTGRPWRPGTNDATSGPADSVDLSSPWDLAWYDDRIIIAMAGIHQLWSFDPRAGTVAVYAGTTVESLRDGELHESWMAQPSGLASQGDTLWIADSETSALRYIRNGLMHTAVGQGLFDFGHVDGPAETALLQHPLGVGVLPDGRIGIADTYNGALRCYDPISRRVSTLANDLEEPSDVLVAGGRTLVVESAAHRIRQPELDRHDHTGARYRVTRPATTIAPGQVELEVLFTPAPGQKLDTSFGPSTRLTVTSDPATLLINGAGENTRLTRSLTIADDIEHAVLQVVAQAATCDADSPHPACHLTKQDWGVPVNVSKDGARRLTLTLRDEPAQQS